MEIWGKRARWVFVAEVFWCVGLQAVVEGLRFEVPGSSTKCIAEEIQQGVLVVGDYKVVDTSHKITAKLTAPHGDLLHLQENVESGQFGFTTKRTGSYLACFWLNNVPQGVTIFLDLEWKTGVAAKDWSDIAKKDKLDDMELELRKLEEAVESIHDEMLFLRDREAEMRNLNEITNARVAWFSIMSLLVCLTVAGWQLWHLKSFFERKKLL